MMLRSRVLWATLLSIVISENSLLAAQLYSLTNLGVLPGQADSTAYAINDAGQIVGESASGSTGHAFLYFGGVMTDLTPTATYSQAVGINSSGNIVGAYHAVTNDGRAYLYDQSGFHSLSVGGAASGARDINDAGAIALEVYFPGTFSYVYNNGVLTNITPSATNNSVPYRMNNSGMVTGVGYHLDPQAFLYTPGGQSVYLPKLSADTQSAGYGINSDGDVVGHGIAALPVRERSFLYTHDGQLSELLPVSGKLNAYATAINDSGIIVGTSGSSFEVEGPRATLWQNGAAFSLTALLDNSGENWIIYYANDINNSGQIVGFGTYDEDGAGPGIAVARAVLLTPVPEPGYAGLLFIIASAPALRRNRRRFPRQAG